jgi:hypothetical protein
MGKDNKRDWYQNRHDSAFCFIDILEEKLLRRCLDLAKKPEIQW